MDIITEIINTFSEKERNEFRHFLLRQKYSEKRKDLELFDRILAKKKTKENLSADSYHGLRRRLMRHLSDYIILKEKSEDITDTGVVTGWVSLSKYLFRHGLNKAAWKYLKRAESTAWETDQFEMLGSIYLVMIEFAHLSEDISLFEIIQKKNRARKLTEENENVLIATALIRKRLEECKVNLNMHGFPEYVEQVFDSYKLNTAILDRPAHFVKLLEIVRSTYLALRDLKNFEDFILEHYSQYDKFSVAKKHHHESRLRFLYMIAHVLFRNRKFKKSMKFLNEFYERMQDYDGIYFRKYYPVYISLQSSLKSLSGDNNQSVLMHEELLKNKKLKLNQANEYNALLNLIFFYFNSKLYRKANALFIRFEHSDKYLAKIMGQEWVIRKRMIQLIVQYELGHEEISLQMITQIEKDFHQLFQLPQYRKAYNFLGMIRNFITDPYKLNFREFREQAGKELFSVHPEEEESKAIAFYCWLKSKITGKDYYKTLLEEVKSNDDFQF